MDKNDQKIFNRKKVKICQNVHVCWLLIRNIQNKFVSRITNSLRWLQFISFVSSSENSIVYGDNTDIPFDRFTYSHHLLVHFIFSAQKTSRSYIIQPSAARQLQMLQNKPNRRLFSNNVCEFLLIFTWATAAVYKVYKFSNKQTIIEWNFIIVSLFLKRFAFQFFGSNPFLKSKQSANLTKFCLKNNEIQKVSFSHSYLKSLL